MGLFSSIKKGLSKAWKGVKKTVKKVARGVKKVAKGIATSVPGGHKLWKEAGRLGKKIMKGIGKLGPVGMMALSFVLAPVMGPMVGALWSGFGTMGTTLANYAAANAGTLMGTLASGAGAAVNGIYAAGNWVGGTLGRMGDAIIEGGSNIMKGEFSAGLKSFSSNMGQALSGEAGMASVEAGAAKAAAGAAANATETLGQTASQLGAPGVDNAEILKQMQQQSSSISNFQQQSVSSLDSLMERSPNLVHDEMAAMTDKQLTQLGHHGKGSTLADSGATQAFKGVNVDAAPLTDRVQEFIETVGAGGGSPVDFEPIDMQSPVTPGAISSVRASDPRTGGGVGSAGFSLLSGVQGLEQSIRSSQRLMFS